MISLKYNKKKLFLLLIFSLSMLVFFAFLFFNAEGIALSKPSSTIKYRYFGELFYKKENLIKSFSIVLSSIFIYVAFPLVKMLISKNLIYKSQNGFFYQDNKLIIEISKIKSLRLKETNKNYFINFHLHNVKQFIEDEPNLLQKIKYKLINFTENTPVILNISYLENKPEVTFNKVRKLIKK